MLLVRRIKITSFPKNFMTNIETVPYALSDGLIVCVGINVSFARRGECIMADCYQFLLPCNLCGEYTTCWEHMSHNPDTRGYCTECYHLDRVRIYQIKKQSQSS